MDPDSTSKCDLDFSDCETAKDGLQKLKDMMHTDIPLLERRFLSTDDIAVSDASSSICVMQWNVLAQALTGGKDNFVRCPQQVLLWERRRLTLLEEILSCEPDILCLQEMDQFTFFQSTLMNFGYKGFFQPKLRSPCLQISGNNGPDGCAILYKVSRFDVLDSDMSYLDQDFGKPNRGYIVLHLEEKSINKSFYVATTHLKAKEGFEEHRLQEGKKLLEKLEGNTKPVIVCGDFNAIPTEPVIKAFKDSTLNLKNTYEAIKDLPPYTTWKIRRAKPEEGGEEQDICRNIDYIWCSDSKLHVSALFSIPTETEIGKDRLPSHSYPSDHFSIAAILHLR